MPTAQTGVIEGRRNIHWWISEIECTKKECNRIRKKLKKVKSRTL